MKKILIADDRKHIRELVSAIIGPEQYEIFEAGDGMEALEIAKRERPALLLLDLAMPYLDGFEVCRVLKSDPETAGTHIIIITAYGQDEYREKARTAGADDFFAKPFGPTELLERIREVLEGDG